MAKTLRIGTRRSTLAQAQAHWIADRLRAVFPGTEVELVLITTTGDQLPSSIPAGAPNGGGLKSLFTKEIEEALLEKRIDLAVHSLKDMAADLPAGLVLGAVPKREDARDAWISKNRTPFMKLPAGSKIGTGSVRRQAQVRRFNSAFETVPMRGNVDTRIKKLEEGNLDGILLAMAGLKRLGLEAKMTEALPMTLMLPAAGQGCLAIEARDGDSNAVPFLKALNHEMSLQSALAERAFLKTLGGSCQTPIAAYSFILADTLRIEGRVLSPSGAQGLEGSDEGPAAMAEDIGRRLALTLLSEGADTLLKSPS